MTMLSLRRYTPADHDMWNDFVLASKNGTILLHRQFMDYHSDRFVDHSLIVCNGSRIVCLLPANYEEESCTLYSHQGLTYGGLILSRKTTGVQVLEAMDLIVEYCRTTLQAKHFVYKPIPYIYSSYPSQEDLYALFRQGAVLKSRGLSSCIDLTTPISFSESRKSGLRKSADIVIRQTDDTLSFWNILNEVLTTLHGVRPVHTAMEMELLMKRFPDNIRLFGAYSAGGTMLAGAFVFDCGNVVHTQYLASSHQGKETGALDKLIVHLIQNAYHDSHYLDFGISTEQGGTLLNEGLLFQKEGFGARGVCYDCYEINI